MTDATSTPLPRQISRREVLAFIALQDLPMPKLIHFHESNSGVGLTLDHIADLTRWADAFGIPVHSRNASGDWRGRTVYLNAPDYVDADVEPLDGDTVARLREITDQPGAPEGEA